MFSLVKVIYSFFIRREGTTEDQDTIIDRVKDEAYTSGSGNIASDVAPLIKKLALDYPVPASNFSLISGYYDYQTDRRSKINRPESGSGSGDGSGGMNHIDPSAIETVEAETQKKPFIGMPMQCKITGQENDMKGTLQFLGQVPEIPERDNILVAGVELESDLDFASDGTYLGRRYFRSPPNRAYFTSFKNCNVL